MVVVAHHIFFAGIGNAAGIGGEFGPGPVHLSVILTDFRTGKVEQ